MQKVTRLNDSCFSRAHGLRRDKCVNNFYMLSEYSSAQKESVVSREKTQDWYTESRRKCFKDYTEFHLQHNGKDSSSTGNKKQSEFRNSEISPWGCLPNQKGSRPKNEESKRRPTSKLWPLSVKGEQGKGWRRRQGLKCACFELSTWVERGEKHSSMKCHNLKQTPTWVRSSNCKSLIKSDPCSAARGNWQQQTEILENTSSMLGGNNFIFQDPERYIKI